jgi:hypothetical protein
MTTATRLSICHSESSKYISTAKRLGGEEGRGREGRGEEGNLRTERASERASERGLYHHFHTHDVPFLSFIPDHHAG